MNVEKQKYYYEVYGLKVESEIEIKEFVVMKNNVNENVDVKFSYGHMDDDIKESLKSGMRINLTKNRIWFHIENVASYCISNGNLVIVEQEQNTDLQLLKVYLMCSCLGFIMIQRNKVAIHGGTVVVNGKGIIVAGDRGAGKSTLTTALRLKGYEFLSDDVAATIMSNYPKINPGFPYQKLCKDSIDNIGVEMLGYTSCNVDGKVKYMVPVKESFYNENVELYGICELVVGEGEEIETIELIGHEKLNGVIRNIFRGEYIRYLDGMPPEYFKKCVEIAQYVKFYRIVRPKNKFTVEDQIKHVEDLFV